MSEIRIKNGTNHTVEISVAMDNTGLLSVGQNASYFTLAPQQIESWGRQEDADHTVFVRDGGVEKQYQREIRPGHIKTYMGGWFNDGESNNSSYPPSGDFPFAAVPTGLLGVGSNGSVSFRRSTSFGDWELLPGIQHVLAVAGQDKGAVGAVGLGTNHQLYYWMQGSGWGLGGYMTSGCGEPMRDFTVLKDRSFLGIAMDNTIWILRNLDSKWSKVNNSGDLMSVAQMPDGTILGVGMDNYLWTQSTITSPWTRVEGSGSVKSIAVMQNGAIVGVGMNDLLFMRKTLGDDWLPLSGSIPVVKIALGTPIS